MRSLLVAAMLLVIAVSACADDGDDLDGDPTASPSPSASGGGAVVICPHVNIVQPGETPPPAATADPSASCEPGADMQVAPGVRGRISQLPVLPDGLVAVTDYVEFDQREGTPATIGLPVKGGVNAEGGAFYTYEEGEWVRLADVSLEQGGGVVEGRFDPLPANLVVLVADG